MNTPRIIITMENSSSGLALKNFLLHNEFEVVGLSTSGNDSLRKTRILRPDFLIINYQLPDMSGLNVARILTEENICTVILFATSLQREQIDKTTLERDDFTDIVCIEKPINKSILINTLNLLYKTKIKISKLEKEVITLKDTLESKKYIEKAKGILMKTSGITEAEAYRRLQKKSMDNGISMKNIAKLIIDTIE